LPDLQNIRFIQAESIADFEKIILKVDQTQNLIIYATHVLYQFAKAELNELYSMLEKTGEKRDFYFLSVEGIPELLERYNSKEIVIELIQFKNKKSTATFIAETNGHGNWIKWNQTPHQSDSNQVLTPE
jgi:hypothetical protein